MDQSILAELSSLMMQAIVQHYEDLLQKSCDDRGDDVTGIPQQCSLQLQFNLNFLTSVLLVQEVHVYMYVHAIYAHAIIIQMHCVA